MPFRIVTLGDSIPWGQGLLDNEKFDSLVRVALGPTHVEGVTLDRVAHSGAVIGDQGATGATGATGPQGPSGSDTLNDFYLSGAIPTGGWISRSSNAYSVSHQVPSISLYPNIVVSGSFEIGSSVTSYPLPAINVFTAGDQLTYSYGNDTISILYFNATPPPSQINYKIYVLIIN